MEVDEKGLPVPYAWFPTADGAYEMNHLWVAARRSRGRSKVLDGRVQQENREMAGAKQEHHPLSRFEAIWRKFAHLSNGRGNAACQACTNKNRPCMRWMRDRLVILPLTASLRVNRRPRDVRYWIMNVGARNKVNRVDPFMFRDHRDVGAAQQINEE